VAELRDWDKSVGELSAPPKAASNAGCLEEGGGRESLADSPGSLARNRTFHAFTATQFLGAFNDNLFKQLVLLLFVRTPVPGEPGQHRDQQWVALLLFSLPFILFSGLGGYLSDRYRKWSVIFGCKAAEVAIMLLAVIGFAYYSRAGLTPAVFAALGVTLFLMGTHSAFFGPSKYGALPEYFAAKQLSAVNGIVLMTTFLAIIFGSVLAGYLLDWWSERLWMAGCVSVGVAGVGVATALMLPRLPSALPGLRFSWDMLFIPRDIGRLLRADIALRRALLASTLFWLVAAIVQPAVNALGKLQLLEDNRWTSLLVMVISAGIAAGSVLAGWFSRHSFQPWVPRLGAWGMVACLSMLAIPAGAKQHLLGYWGSIVALTLLGGFTGLFAVPLNVFLQSRPPAGLKGRTVATQNLLNWVGIFISTVIYWAANSLLGLLHWPNNGLFALTALLMLPIAVAYRPPHE
jgi:MFS family permease